MFYAPVRNASFRLGALNFAQLKPVYDLLLIFYVAFTSKLSHCREKYAILFTVPLLLMEIVGESLKPCSSGISLL